MNLIHGAVKQKVTRRRSNQQNKCVFSVRRMSLQVTWVAMIKLQI